MSQTIVSVLVIILSQLLPKLGIEIGSDALTTTLSTLITLGAAIYIWVRRHQVGDISVAGVRQI